MQFFPFSLPLYFPFLNLSSMLRYFIHHYKKEIGADSGRVGRRRRDGGRAYRKVPNGAPKFKLDLNLRGTSTSPSLLFGELDPPSLPGPSLPGLAD